MSIDVKDFSLGTAKSVKATLFDTEYVPHHLIASSIDGAPLLSDGMFDAFGRLRISNPTTLFDGAHQYRLDSRTWDTGLSVNGTVTHLPNESSVQLSTAAGTSGNKAILQTKNYLRYQPGKSQLIVMTFLMGAEVANVVRRAGYFDADNGVFLEQDGNSGVSVVIRSKASGAVVDNPIYQATWNIDPMDGTGPSGLTLDLETEQILAISMQWLGVGSVEFGFVINRKYHPVHREHHANLITSVYMTTANLPVRYEIVNSGAAVGANTFNVTCVTVISEGGSEDNRYWRFAAGNGATLLSTTTIRPLFSIRPALTHNSIAFRGLIRPLAWSGFGDASAYYTLILNGSLTGASFAAVDATNSAVEKDVSATAITGGVVIDDMYVGTAGSSPHAGGSNEILGRVALSLDAAGSVQDVLTVCATRYSGTTNCGGSIRWAEEK